MTKDNGEASAWRAMALSELGKHPEAVPEFQRGDQVTQQLPPLIRRRYMLDEIATAIETGDFDTARSSSTNSRATRCNCGYVCITATVCSKVSR